MDALKKFGLLEKAADFVPDMAKVNRQALRELKAEEIFAFRIAAADDNIDRQVERFTPECLEGMAKLFVGKPVIMDHRWSAGNQTARIYDGYTDKVGNTTRLVLCAYMLRNDETKATVDAIEGGILREVSVGCQVGKATCSICGTDLTTEWCKHRKGETYDGQLCHVLLDDPIDAYELSFVAVPAQQAAGVVKQYGGEKNPVKDHEPPASGGDPGQADEVSKALELMDLEEKRYMD